MKKLVRMISLLLVLVFVLSAFAACDKDKEEDPCANGHTPGEWQVMKEATEKEAGKKTRFCTKCAAELESVEIPKKDGPYEVPDGLDQYDLYYSEEKITVLYWEDVERPEFEKSETVNNAVHNAIRERNDSIEERLGVELVFESSAAAYGNGTREAFIQKVNAVHMSSLHSYDIIAAQSRTEGGLAIRGHLQDLSKIQNSYMDMSKPWWPQRLLESVSFGNGSYYFVSGDMSTNAVYMMLTMFYNKDLFSSLKLEDPCALARSGNWTVDKMIELTKDQWRDLDEDGKLSINDQVGLCGMQFVGDAFYHGAGMRTLVADSTNLLKLSEDYTSAKAATLINKLGAWAATNDVWMFASTNEEMSSATRQLFTKGNTLLWLEHFSYAETFKDRVNFDYGILPAPKYDSAQTSYYTDVGNPVSLYGIFVDLDARGNKQEALSMVSAVMECWASEGYRRTTPAIYKMSFADSYAVGQDDTDMFECLRSNVMFDLGKILAMETENLAERSAVAIINNSAWEEVGETYASKAKPKISQIAKDLKDIQAS